MEFPDALRAARRAYERAHVIAALRGLAIAVGVVITVVYAVLITVVVMLLMEAGQQPIPPGIDGA